MLEHLDLQVNRLIRLSFGPFQLGQLAEGAVEEVPRRVLRQQLGKNWHMLAGNGGAGNNGDDSNNGGENSEAGGAPRREKKPARPTKPRKPDAHHRR